MRRFCLIAMLMFLGLLCSIAVSRAACPSTPLANGTTADATQVMNWFDCKASVASPVFTGNVGIGTNTTSANLTISSASSPTWQLERTGAGGAGILVTGSVITTIQASHDGTTWTDAISIGANNGGGGVNDGYVGIGLAGGLPQNPFQVGTASFVVNSSANVGIGTASPGQLLDVGGTIRQSGCTTAGTLAVNGSGDIICGSDARLKNILGDYKGGLNALAQITPKLFTFKQTRADPKETFVHAGFVAQNVKAAIPQASARQRDGYYSLDTTSILAASVNAIKQLKALNESQVLEIQQLRSRLGKLERAVASSSFRQAHQAKLECD